MAMFPTPRIAQIDVYHPTKAQANADFRAWLAEQADERPDEEYVFTDTYACALAQWAKAMWPGQTVFAGSTFVSVGGIGSINVTETDAEIDALAESTTWGELYARF